MFKNLLVLGFVALLGVSCAKNKHNMDHSKHSVSEEDMAKYKTWACNKCDSISHEMSKAGCKKVCKK